MRRGTISLLLALLMTVAACGGGTAESTTTLGGDSPATTVSDEAPETTETAEMTTVRIGYQHTEAIDPALLIGVNEGYFDEEGVDLELIRFDTGPAQSQALLAGDIDVAVAGAALVANFAASGNAVLFLPSFIEYDTQTLLAHPDSGIESVADLAGSQVALPIGTTAHVMLYTALVGEGVDPDSVELVNMSMSEAATAFMAGAVPAASLWIPHQFRAMGEVPDARVLATLADYFPDSVVLGGYVADPTFHEENGDALERLAVGWLRASEKMLADEDARRYAWETAYQEDETFEEFTQNWETVGYPTASEWQAYVDEGQVGNWIETTQEIMVAIGAKDEVVPVDEFFDSGLAGAAYATYADKYAG